jgi:hypothetical protein
VVAVKPRSLTSFGMTLAKEWLYAALKRRSSAVLPEAVIEGVGRLSRFFESGDFRDSSN